MCGQVGLILVENSVATSAPAASGTLGVGGFFLAAALSLPFSVAFGWLTGLLLNRARGREMITGMILGFFANGIYQLVFLLMAGAIIPIDNERLILPSGIGLRNTIDLVGTREVMDRLVRPIVTLGPTFRMPIPVATLVFIALGCVAIRWFLRTKAGQDLRATGQDLHVAEISGIAVQRTRLLAIVLSTVLGAIGHILWLSNVGTMNTYQSHEQVGPYAIAALLIGGATIERATIWHAILGTLLFHSLFVISPIAGQNLLGSPQVGEYFREFIAYAVIGVTLALHAWNKRSS
jgi:simple sugar transport system permease protein